MDEEDTIHISGKAVSAIVILLLLLFSTFGMFFLNRKAIIHSSDSQGSDLPEKCRLPAGQDIVAWKEHLGHHAETEDCLKYLK